MGLISFIVLLASIGVALYIVNAAMPAPAWIKMVINFVAAVFVLLAFLRLFGYHSGLHLTL